MVDTAPQPQFGSLVKIGKEGWAGVPDGESPFYVGAYDGLWAHRRMMIGRGMAKVDFWPKSFSKFSAKDLEFQFEADPIPAKIMGQIVSFFERIYDRQHTEAAVLLVMHETTREWRVFVPTQLVSHGGVNYVFEPQHIKRPWFIVGSIHSHCDFGASHSSTDTGDADGFDGLHCTIGHIKDDIPQIVAMVAMNKKLKHFPAEEFPTLFDFSEAKQHEAPAWWDRYVENPLTKTKPVGFGLYAKYQKTTVVKSETKTTITKFHPSQPKAYDPSAWVYSEKAKRMVHKDWIIEDDGTISYKNGSVTGKVSPYTSHPGLSVVRKPNQNERDDRLDPERMTAKDREELVSWLMRDELEDDSPAGGYSAAEMRALGFSWNPDSKMWLYTQGADTESREFNARRVAERGVKWAGDGSLNRGSEDTLGLREQGERYWEDELDVKVRDLIFDSDLLTDDDIEWAMRNPSHASDPAEWSMVFYKKALSAVEALRTLGFDVDIVYTPTPKPPEDLDIILLPEPQAQQHQQGAN